MFKTYNVADSLWQMNLFMAMQVQRNLSTLSYYAAPPSIEDESHEDKVEEIAGSRSASRTRSGTA